MRRVVQALSALVLNAAFLFQFGPLKQFGEFLNWGKQYGCLPVLNCHSCPVAINACPIGVLGHLTEWRYFPAYVLGVVFGIAAVFGRFLCGWVCPFGFLQDLLHRVPLRKIRIPRVLKYVKYGLLVVSVLAVPYFLDVFSWGFFCRLCPQATLESAIPRWANGSSQMQAGPAAARLAVLAAVILLAVVSERFFCRVLCPIGALVAPFGKVSPLRVRRDTETCIHCKRCDRVCPMDLQPSTQTGDAVRQTSGECIVCSQCTHVCPVPRTLRWGMLGLWGGGRGRTSKEQAAESGPTDLSEEGSPSDPAPR